MAGIQSDVVRSFAFTARSLSSCCVERLFLQDYRMNVADRTRVAIFYRIVEQDGELSRRLYVVDFEQVLPMEIVSIRIGINYLFHFLR